MSDKNTEFSLENVMDKLIDLSSEDYTCRYSLLCSIKRAMENGIPSCQIVGVLRKLFHKRKVRYKSSISEWAELRHKKLLKSMEELIDSLYNENRDDDPWVFNETFMDFDVFWLYEHLREENKKFTYEQLEEIHDGMILDFLNKSSEEIEKLVKGASVCRFIYPPGKK